MSEESIGEIASKVRDAVERVREVLENHMQTKAMGMDLVVKPKKSRLNPWKYDKELYKKRNEAKAVPAVERLSPSVLPL